MTDIHDVYKFYKDVSTKYGSLVDGQLTMNLIGWSTGFIISTALVALALILTLNVVKSYNAHRLDKPHSSRGFMTYVDNHRQGSGLIVFICFVAGLLVLVISIQTILEIIYTPEVWIYKKFHDMEI